MGISEWFGGNHGRGAKSLGPCQERKGFGDPLLKVGELVSRARFGRVGLPDWHTDATADTMPEKVHQDAGNETDTP